MLIQSRVWVMRLASLFAAVGCASGNSATLEPIAAQSVRVSETLRVPLVVQSSGSRYDLRYAGPDLAGLTVTSAISTGAGGGEFQWTPLASHVGRHEFIFSLVVDGEVVDSQPTLIEVEPADDAAPVFLQPGPGGTYDLSRNPCVSFNIEIRDNDTEEVAITAIADVPLGTDPVMPIGPKSARFEWCPTEDQISASQRWSVRLSADDGDHPPTLLDHVVILRSKPKDNCPGTPPTIEILSPTQGEQISGTPSFAVRIRAEDETAIREAPIVYYTMTRPDDFLNPDVASFTAQVDATGSGPEFEATIPDLGLGVDDSLTLYVVASVTDNDDPSGTRCDHSTDTSVLSFVAVGSDALGAPCAPCSASDRCGSSVCAADGSGVSRCLSQCDACPGACVESTTVEGLAVQSCPASACGTVTNCQDDALEDNDSIATASLLNSGGRTGKICGSDADFFRINVPGGTRTEIRLTGDPASTTDDLDLMTLDENGRVLQVGESLANDETLFHCSATATTLYARVYGYGEQDAGYTLDITQTSSPCCIDDTFEDDDSIPEARMLSSEDFEGTICAGDSDYIGFSIGAASEIDALIVFDHADGDLDLGLADDSGFLLAASATSNDEEQIVGILPDPGSYILVVTGFQGAETDYLGSLSLAPVTSCAGPGDCGDGSICDSSVCVDSACADQTDCPSDYLCVRSGPDSDARVCAPSCSVNNDCGGSEACKRHPEGRACGKTGSGQNGDPCSTFASCGGQRVCLGYPDGYCARAACSTAADCESGTHCVDIGGENVCAKDCVGTTCRFFYTCADAVDTAGAPRLICEPL